MNEQGSPICNPSGDCKSCMFTCVFSVTLGMLAGLHPTPRPLHNSAARERWEVLADVLTLSTCGRNQGSLSLEVPILNGQKASL